MRGCIRIEGEINWGGSNAREGAEEGGGWSTSNMTVTSDYLHTPHSCKA